MTNYITIFSQLIHLIPRNIFNKAVAGYSADKYVKHFNTWRLLIVLLYAQITGKTSLRDIETGLNSHKNKFKHLGLSNISKSNIAHACKNRNHRVLESLFLSLYSHCVSAVGGRRFRFKMPAFALDSTLINLCLTLFPWADYRQKKGAMKLHCLLDLQKQIPAFVVMSEGRPSDIKIARSLDLGLSRDSILVMDRGYMDFDWFRNLDEQGIFFVTRAKSNLDCRVLGQHTINESKTVLGDDIIELCCSKSKKAYPERLRLVTVYDEEKDKAIRILTNNWSLAASTIGKIYKARWKIEEFFRWIKQNLKIKTFIGCSENAVMLQVWTAMIYYLLIFYMKAQTRFDSSLLELSRRIRATIFEGKHILDLLTQNFTPPQKLNDYAVQMNLF